MRIRLVVVIALALGAMQLLVSLGWTHWSTLRETLTVIGELGIVVVIYYEVEENRSASFLESVSETRGYHERANIYEAYVSCDGSSLAERAEHFRREIWSRNDLRKSCDAQWVHFTRLQYGVRRSFLHKNLLAEWYPHVIVSMWVMLGTYIEERQQLRPSPATKFFQEAVKRSLTQLEKGKVKQLVIFGQADKRVTITQAELNALRANLLKPLGIDVQAV